jgi:hypothetical protein
MREKSGADGFGRWRTEVVLKRDVFSTVERGRLLAPEGEVQAIARRLDQVPWWSAPLAHLLFARERRALIAADGLGVAPPLLFSGRNLLVRRWIDGVALHIAKPHHDLAYFRSAKAALRKLHRALICHNDLAKEQNWLRGADGRAYLIDFQLASRFRRRHLLFRLAAYEDLRHLLKHKARYAPEGLTAMEKRVLARKSLPTRVWMATGKRVYRWITRGLFRVADREGSGLRLARDAPALISAFKQNPKVREVAIVTYPERKSGTGLYAFVEAPGLSEEAVRKSGALADVPAPERLQVVDTLPRTAAGDVRTEILQLIAMNQVDLIAPLIADEGERATIARIVDGRRNLRDRFAL